MDVRRKLLDYIMEVDRLIPSAVEKYEEDGKVYALDTLMNQARGLIQDLQQVESSEAIYDKIVVQVVEKLLRLWLQDLTDELGRAVEEINQNPGKVKMYMADVLKGLSVRAKEHYTDSLQTLATILDITMDD